MLWVALPFMFASPLTKSKKQLSHFSYSALNPRPQTLHPRPQLENLKPLTRAHKPHLALNLNLNPNLKLPTRTLSQTQTPYLLNPKP